jgi:TetR/AcrR family transcriptional regulator, transcriptional repressor for nem operon
MLRTRRRRLEKGNAAMAVRAEQKQASLRRILTAAAARLRTEGLSGAAIAPVMQDAGLTHGAFYAHFADKSELAAAAFRHALHDNRLRWTAAEAGESRPRRFARLARRYLTPAHRDTPADGCAFAAVASEAARGPAAFRRVFEEEFLKSVNAVCGGEETDPACRDEALALMALCVGGIQLARAVADPELSERILAACRAAATRLNAG